MQPVSRRPVYIIQINGIVHLMTLGGNKSYLLLHEICICNVWKNKMTVEYKATEIIWKIIRNPYWKMSFFFLKICNSELEASDKIY
jgi:hypothetical protein